ncbi:MAG: S41 family peptidase [Proteobacteria bacterium]|nr:S41 family peptidase [Pseudomonadota bacterium]
MSRKEEVKVERKSKVWILSLGGILGLVLTTAVGVGFFLGARRGVQAENTYEKLELLSDVLYTIQKNYVDETNSDKLLDGAIRGMVASLDPYSSFLNRDEYQEINVETKGKFGGLGIEVAIREGVLTVISPLEDSPASRAGILAQDQIVKIDGEATRGLSLAEAVKKLRGPQGTKVAIAVMRAGFTEPKNFSIIRDIIKIKSVKKRIIEPGYLYARIAQFQEQTKTDLKKALLDSVPPEGGLKGIILDLRNNPGGLLDQAIEVSDFFLPEGLIVYTKGRSESQKVEYKAGSDPVEKKWDCPIVILINGGTASAAEIVTGALKDNKRAIVLGTKTFGKGSVQTIIPMRENTALRLTTARYYTPNGTSIQGVGIAPDIEVLFPLPERMLPPGKSPEPGKGVETEKPGEENEMVIPGEPGDPQYDRAWQLLKSWEVFHKILSPQA